MSFWIIISWLGLSFWDLFKSWLSAIFIAPFQNFNMFWILIPIYLGWIVADFFQEKRGTSLGNAISNGVIPLWAGIDWMRTTVNYIVDRTISMSFWDAAARFFLAALVLAYGMWIIYDGVKGKALTKYIGRVRTVSYVVILLTPVFYNVILLSLKHILATIIFFPAFYFLIEYLEQDVLPDPQSIADEKTRIQ